MEVKVVYGGGKRFEAIARNHRVISDQPLDDHGTDRGITPPELFLASLGTCIGYYAAEYLNARDLPADGLEVKVSAAKGGKPVRIATIDVTVSAPGADSDLRHREGLRRAVEHCLIHNTLVALPRMEIRVGAEVPELVAVV
jgi:putative redox protein